MKFKHILLYILPIFLFLSCESDSGWKKGYIGVEGTFPTDITGDFAAILILDENMIEGLHYRDIILDIVMGYTEFTIYGLNPNDRITINMELENGAFYRSPILRANAAGEVIVDTQETAFRYFANDLVREFKRNYGYVEILISGSSPYRRDFLDFYFVQELDLYVER